MPTYYRFLVVGTLIGLNTLLFREYLFEKWKLNGDHSTLRKWIQKSLQVMYGIFFLILIYGPMLLPGVLKDLPKEQETLQAQLLAFNLVGTLMSLAGVLYFKWKFKKQIR